MHLFLTLAGLLATASAGLLPRTPQVVPGADAAPVADIPVMVPLNLAAFKEAVGEARTAAEPTGPDYSALEPTKQAEFVFGTPGDDGSMVIANMTLHAPDGKLLVAMESFEGMTKAIDCEGTDGLLSVTFNDKETFQKALDSWSYIHEDENEEFILITNHAGCGPDNQRQPYLITDVDNDEENFITYLTAAPTAWEKFAGSFEMDFGQASLDTGAQAKLMRRELHTMELDIPVKIHSPYSPLNIYTATNMNVKCSNCFVAGSFKLSGRLVLEFFDVTELSLRVKPVGFNAALEVTTTVTVTAGYTRTVSKETELIKGAIPGVGFSIPGIFTLGGIVGIDAGLAMKFDGTAAFTLGLRARIPDTAVLFVDLADKSRSYSSGWNKATITPVYRLDNLEVGIDGDLYMEPKIAFQVSVFVAKAEAALSMKLPNIDATGKVSFDNVVAPCAGSTKKFGLKLDVQGKISMDLGLSGEIPGVLDHTSVSYPIFAYSFLKTSRCFPFGTVVDTVA